MISRYGPIFFAIDLMAKQMGVIDIVAEMYNYPDVPKAVTMAWSLACAYLYRTHADIARMDINHFTSLISYLEDRGITFDPNLIDNI